MSIYKYHVSELGLLIGDYEPDLPLNKIIIKLLLLLLLCSTNFKLASQLGAGHLVNYQL